jgi:hypothetical protein
MLRSCLVNGPCQSHDLGLQIYELLAVVVVCVALRGGGGEGVSVGRVGHCEGCWWSCGFDRMLI